MGFLDDVNKKAEDYGVTKGSSDYYKMKEGTNKLRILTKPEVLATHFFGKGTPAIVCVGVDDGCQFHGENAPKDKDGKEVKPAIKMVTYIVDRADNVVKLAELPYSVFVTLNRLQDDEDYAFEGFPIPYDIKVSYSPEEKDPKAIYVTTPSPNRVELTEDEQKAFDAAMLKITPEQHVERKKNKSKVETKYDSMTPPKAAGEDYPENNLGEVTF